MLDYSTYIRSPLWRNQHSKWLKKSGHRCSMFPWIRCGKVKGKYHRYEIHHLHLKAYDRQGCERYWLDVIVLCPLAHWIIHRVLGGAKQIRHQKSRFPNTAQWLAHTWCRLPSLGKLLLIGAIALLMWKLAVWTAP